MTQPARFSGPAALHREFSAPLTAIESIALESLKQIASEGRRATQPELCAATGVAYQSGAITGILNRLERKGHITRQIFQRGMIVCIAETGQCTAPPSDTSPHWRLRDRSSDPPAPAIQQTRQRDVSLFTMIEQAARTEGKPITEFLVDLVYIGWHGYAAEREAEA